MVTEEPTDFTPFVTEIMTDLLVELEDRFPGYRQLSQDDRYAIITAVTKGAWRGVLRGIAITTYSVNAQQQAAQDADPSTEAVQISPQLRVTSEPDLWAEHQAGEG